MEREVILHEDVKNIKEVISLPNGIRSFDFELNIQGSVGAGNKFDLEITDYISNIQWKQYRPDGTLVHSSGKLILKNQGNNSSFYIKGNATKTANSERVYYVADVYATYGDYTEHYNCIGVTFSDGMKSLCVRVVYAGQQASGTIVAGSSIKINCNMFEKSKEVALVGDSITNQYQSEFDYFNEKKSVNLGFPGQDVASISNKVNSYVQKYEDNIRYAINMSGTNNIKKSGSSYSVDLDKFRTDYTNLCDIMLTKGTPVNVSILHVDNEQTNGDSSGQRNALVDKMNAIVYDISTAKGIAYIDMNKYMCDSSGSLNSAYSIDGLHLNEAGITYFNKTLSEELKKINFGNYDGAYNSEAVTKSLNGMIYDEDLKVTTKPGQVLNPMKAYHSNGTIAVDCQYINDILRYHMYDENGNRVNAVDFRPDGTIETSKGFVQFEDA